MSPCASWFDAFESSSTDATRESSDFLQGKGGSEDLIALQSAAKAEPGKSLDQTVLNSHGSFALSGDLLPVFDEASQLRKWSDSCAFHASLT